MITQVVLGIALRSGFSASHSTEVTYVPINVDLTTGLIKNRKDIKHKWVWHLLLPAKLIYPYCMTQPQPDTLQVYHSLGNTWRA
jgi:hypothetical protein